MNLNVYTDRFRNVYTVSELTLNIKSLLENEFPIVWINGEISNLRIPSSGHAYFTLKDSKAQINAVLFQAQRRNLKFSLEDGISINGLGRVGVYEVRGTYQIILEHLEPCGVGALQVAFEQLKRKLSGEGLFDDSNKKPLPTIPKKISLLTSPSGSVVHDMLRVLERRFFNVAIEIVPVAVQGDHAANEISEALKLVNNRSDSDLIILARGGGSLEDLMPFNSEIVARAIHHSEIPVISAVGHETDYTIADYVADQRAPTPSAAAEIAVPEQRVLTQTCQLFREKLRSAFFTYLNIRKKEVSALLGNLISPKKRIQDKRIVLDDLFDRLVQSTTSYYRHQRERYRWQAENLRSHNPQKTIRHLRERLENASESLQKMISGILAKQYLELQVVTGKLESLNPLEILTRGYSVVRTIPDAEIIKDSRMVDIGDKLEILLGKGTLFCKVERIDEKDGIEKKL